jgi:homoserine O-acetyltransferase
VAVYASAPTRDKADRLFESLTEELKTADANDLLYAYEASNNYSPEAGLDKIRARVLAINTEDDPANPPELNILPRVIRRVQNGKYLLIPRSKGTAGHRSYLNGRLLAPHVREILE